MRARVSGGIRFMGAKRFLVFLAFLSTADNFETVSSIWIRVSDPPILRLVVPAFEPAWMSQHR